MSRLTLVRNSNAASQAAKQGSRRAAEIMDAAARVFATKGFHGSTTQDIADVLGIRQASLYHYFPSKEVALETVCLIGAEGFYERAKAISDGKGDAESKLAALIESHTTPLIERADYVRVFLNQRQFLPSTSRRKIGRWSRGVERIFEQVIQDGIREGAFRKGLDARLATLAVLGVLNAVPAWIDKESRPVDEIVSGLVDLVSGGLRRR